MFNKTKDGVPLYDPGDNTLKEILTHKFRNAIEDDEYYYLHEESNDPYHESWWVIDKKTRKLYWTYYLDIELNDVMDKATPVDPEELKRALA